MPETHIERK